MNHRSSDWPSRRGRVLPGARPRRFESLESRLVFNAGSIPDELTSIGSTLYFVADDGVHGRQLWTSNGAPFTTSMLTDINPGSVGGDPENLTVVGNLLFFTADDGTNGRQLWVTDGTPADTRLITDINPNGSSDPEDLVDFGGTLFFSADDGTHGSQLWESNGTATGTALVKTINPSGSSDPQDLTVVGSMLYFSADDGTHGRELWSTAGTGALTTALVKDINPGAGSSAPSLLTNFNGTLFFVADDGTDGSELWSTNGTSNGTKMVDDIDPGALGSNPSDLTVFNNSLYFAADDGTHGRQLWSSSGTALGTAMVAPSSGATAPDLLTVDGTALYFTASDTTHGRELWSTTGTASSTKLVDDINPGAASSNPQFLTVSNGTLFFSATGTNGTQLWVSAGTALTTTIVANTGTGAASLLPTQLTDLAGLLFFTGTDSTHGRELWTSDGRNIDTSLVLDIRTDNATVNTAPILNADQSPQLSTIFANWTNNPGTLVSTLLASGAEGNPIEDPDSGAEQGIAVTAVDDMSGTWQYSTNGGTTWTAFGSVTPTSAVLLASDTSTRVRFVPNANFGGDVPDGLTFRAWDQTSGANGGTADTSNHGGETAFSNQTVMAGIRVTPASSTPWQNPVNPDDVNGDGSVTPLDALLVINTLNSTGIRALPNPPTSTDHPEPFYDVSGDNSVTPIDALTVINFLNAQSQSAVVAAAPPAAISPSVDTSGVAFAVSGGSSSGTSGAPAGQNQSAAAVDAAIAQFGVEAADPSTDLSGAGLAAIATSRTAGQMPQDAAWDPLA